MICTSMCRTGDRYRSRNTPPSPNADWASLLATFTAFSISLSLRTTRMPLPPPPAAALIISGKPISGARRTASSGSMRPSVPGTTGTPAAIIVLRAATLSPRCVIASGAGPMNVMPFSAHARANASRSLKNP